MNNQIRQTLDLIRDHTGITLNLCDHFTGIHTSPTGDYFNAILDTRVSESTDYILLERFANIYNLIRVEPNGLCRVAIFINHKNQQS